MSFLASALETLKEAFRVFIFGVLGGPVGATSCEVCVRSLFPLLALCLACQFLGVHFDYFGRFEVAGKKLESETRIGFIFEIEDQGAGFGVVVARIRKRSRHLRFEVRGHRRSSLEHIQLVTLIACFVMVFLFLIVLLKILSDTDCRQVLEKLLSNAITLSHSGQLDTYFDLFSLPGATIRVGVRSFLRSTRRSI